MPIHLAILLPFEHGVRCQLRPVFADHRAGVAAHLGDLVQFAVDTGYAKGFSGVCFPDFGHDITCVDKDNKKNALLSTGKVPIFEPVSDQLMAHNMVSGRRL